MAANENAGHRADDDMPALPELMRRMLWGGEPGSGKSALINLVTVREVAPAEDMPIADEAGEEWG